MKDNNKLERIMKYLGGMQDRAESIEAHREYHAAWMAVWKVWAEPEEQEAHVMAEDAAANHEESKRQLLEGREAELVEAVRKHAHANYERGGWDLVVECWSHEEIAKEIRGAKSEAGAIRKMREAIKPAASYRREIEAEVF